MKIKNMNNANRADFFHDSKSETKEGICDSFESFNHPVKGRTRWRNRSTLSHGFNSWLCVLLFFRRFPLPAIPSSLVSDRGASA